MRVAPQAKRGALAAMARLLGALLSALALFVAPARAETVQYFYDALGRLIGAVDASGGTTLYNYDAAGNLLSVTRGPSGQLAISLFAPDHGKAGDPVTIYGSGFVPGAGGNSVSFNGTPASVTSASATAISTSVPAGATSGPITVTNANGSVTSASAFTVVAAPVIGSVNPSLVGRGGTTRVEIAGSNLAFATAVTFSQPGIGAAILPGVTNATLPISLGVASTVPAGSYGFSVTNAAGTTNSGAVTVTVGVRPSGQSFAVAAPFSVFMPSAPVQPPAAGSSMSVTKPLAVHMPATPLPPPVGDSMSATQPLSVYLPSAPLPPPAGSSMSVTAPVSVSMP
jgi:YD repeat-containing protein